jgi:nucleotide-binding universal stress UspA family protein
MSHLDRIMIATDGSAHSRFAAQLAADIAALAGSEIVVAHVTNVPTGWSLTLTPLPEAVDTIVKRDTEIALSTVAEVLDARGLAHEDIVLHGPVARTLVDEAERRHVDMIVIGRHGMSAVERFLVGSVSSKVMSLAHCPVLVVHRP